MKMQMSPIRVLQVVTYMGRGGLETMLMNYYRHIDRNKVQFDFLVHRDFEADYDREIQSLGGRIFHVSRLVPWSKSYRTELKAFFRAHPEYKIVHVHQDCLSAVALQCAEECGVSVRIAHSHNSNQDKNLKYLIKRHYMKQIPTFATDFFSCGKTAGDWMFCGHPYQILPNAIDAAEYRFAPETRRAVRQELGLEDCCVIGHVGRFHPQKNHVFLLEVFSECLRINPNARLLLVGGGEGRSETEAKAYELRLQGKVIFAGVRSDVNRLLQAMDVFVFPSHYEGLGIAAIEAQAAGLPCVLSEGVPEEACVTDNVCRISLNESPQVWAGCILSQPKTHADTYQQIENAGFDISTNVRKLQDFYLEQWRVNKCAF